MVNYSIVMRGNPMDADAAKKAYASAQYSEVMDINRFAEHIASHGCVYKRADIVAILTMAVDCMREQLLAGQKIQLGDLGDFSVGINSQGAEPAGGRCVQSGGHTQGSPTGGEGTESRQDQCGSYRRGERAGQRRAGLR